MLVFSILHEVNDIMTIGLRTLNFGLRQLI